MPLTDYDILTMIDQQPVPCTAWEVEFLESCLRRGPTHTLSSKQKAVVRRMADEYLSERIVAEWLGQLTLERERRW